MKRREFLQASAATAAGLLSLAGCAGKSGAVRENLGLQLYTLRDSIVQNPKEVLRQVSECGYRKLETFGYNDGKIFGMPFTDFAKYCEDLEMKVVSGHYGLDQATGDLWAPAISDAKSVGQEYMVVPYLLESDRKNLDDYRRVCEKLNKAGEACSKQGIRFGYHNHAFEFETMEGQKPFDVMLQELDPKYVGMEMDIYWVVRAGADPVQYFEKYPQRFEQWHVKDMSKSNPDENADVGTGTIDYKSLFAHAQKSGLKHWYVEQESYPGDPMASVKASAEYLKKL